MGGKRVNGRSGSGETTYPRISSAGSSKGSPIETTSVTSLFNPKKESALQTEDLDDESIIESPPLHRKDSFDIISLLAQEDVVSKSENENNLQPNDSNSSDLPSFWHFVEPESKSQDIFRRPINPHHHPISRDKPFITNNHQARGDKDGGVCEAKRSPDLLQTNKMGIPKRVIKRRKVKKAQSAKVAGLKNHERSTPRFGKRDHEWLRVLTPPGTGCSSIDSANNDSEDELIRRYFSGLSSAGSSISWAEDAMESEFTTQLMKLWEDIETVCGGGNRPDSMTEAVYHECMQWRKAFPNPDLHRFSSVKNEGDLSSVESPTLEEERDRVDADEALSSLVHSSTPRNSGGGRKSYDENLSAVQANFRALNCSTPRPNIEKSTEYVNAWLTECQNSHVPEGDRHLPDHRNNQSSSPSIPAIYGSSNRNSEHEAETSCNMSRQSHRLVTEVEKSSYPHYSRNHAKFVNEPDPTNFFTSLAITNSENYGPQESKVNADFTGNYVSSMGVDIHNMPFGLPRFNNTNSYQTSRINESDEEDEDGSNTPTEIMSFRPNVRVQRPISSRVRDHAITPIATGALVHSSFGGRHNTGNLSKQATVPTIFQSSQPAENYRFGGRLRLFDSLTNNAIPMPTQTDMGSSTNRIRSGLVRQGHSLASQLGRSKQQPWSRHSGDDIAAEANYVTSLYENYPSIGTRNIEEEGIRDSTNATGPNNFSSAKGSRLYYERSPTIEGPHSLVECEDRSFKPTTSWIMNR